MSGSLTVGDINVPTALANLKNSTYLVPRFQREFVWSVAQIIALTHSVIDGRPIGMITLWEQEERSPLELEPVSIPDWNHDLGHREDRYFADRAIQPAHRFAILDGRQRCTALAMVFAGLKPTSRYFSKFRGRYFLDVTASDATERIVFVKEIDIARRGLDAENACISKGLFPLTSYEENEPLFQTWMRYVQAIQDPQFYEQGSLPTPDELKRRDDILKHAFEGINETKIAVYTVGTRYGLGEICDIFETLNTTGTRVSTVDLVHSWLVRESQNNPEGPLDLRNWLDGFGQLDGAVGWSSSRDRPELIAQIVTACYIALDQKGPPRQIAGSRSSDISSIKSSDLLATPLSHWRRVMCQQDLLAGIFSDFQHLVAGGLFPFSLCPYPASAAVYIALRFHEAMDSPDAHPWRVDDLDTVYRAFFWRNALSNRYDQGFLTQLGADIRKLSGWLSSRSKFPNSEDWCAFVDKEMNDYFKTLLPTTADLIDLLTNGRPGGAIQRALVLPMFAGTTRDFVDPDISIAFPEGDGKELRHIYPVAWCETNVEGQLAAFLDPGQAGRDWIDGICNLVPLSRKSNNRWKNKSPSEFLIHEDVKYASLEEILPTAYISRDLFELLKQGRDGLPSFWSGRAELIAVDIWGRTRLTLPH